MRFAYTARDAAGVLQRGSLDSPSRRDALRTLTARDVQVITLDEATAAANAASGAPSSPPARVAAAPGPAERLPFLEALADLIASGLPAGEAIRLLSQRLKAPRLRALCAGLWEQLAEGRPLSEALASYSGIFDLQTVALVAAGEATGNLREVLQRLIQHFTEQREMRRKLTAALAYPVLICVVAAGVIVFFITFLLPRLQTLLATLGGELPLATRLLLGLAHGLTSYGLVVAGAAAAGIAAFVRWRRTERGRLASDTWLLRVPWIGRFVTQSAVYQFSDTLAVLIENGVTTAEALRMTERTVSQRAIRRAFATATDRVLEGERLSSALQRTGCFPDLVLDRLSVGESTGQLAPSLRHLARSTRDQLTRQIHALTTLVPSLVLVAAFSFVAFLAYAIVSAVFQVSASFKF